MDGWVDEWNRGPIHHTTLGIAWARRERVKALSVGGGDDERWWVAAGGPHPAAAASSHAVPVDSIPPPPKQPPKTNNNPVSALHTAMAGTHACAVLRGPCLLAVVERCADHQTWPQ